MPRVSVIIPCYKHAHYLPHAVNSVLAQTFADWEAIIVDDGSPDDTAAVASSFTDARVRYMYQENRGLAGARNAGIQSARGEYLAFLDADDEWEPAFLERCSAVLSARPELAGVYTLSYFIDPDGKLLPQVGGEPVAEEDFRMRNLEGGFFPVHAALVRAAVVRGVGLFDTQLTSEEDWDLWIRIAEHYTMACISLPLARYRVYPGSMSTDAERMHLNALTILTKYWGPPVGDSQAWSFEKRRAYAFAYQGAAYQFIQQQEPDIGWQHLYTAVTLWPALLERLGLFYELACSAQPKGYRGRGDLMDIDANGRQLLKRLDALFGRSGLGLSHACNKAYSNAYLALAMLSDQGGHWGQARRYLLQAIKANPGLAVSPTVARRLAKLCSGQRLAGFVRRLRAGKS